MSEQKEGGGVVGDGEERKEQEVSKKEASDTKGGARQPWWPAALIVVLGCAVVVLLILLLLGVGVSRGPQSESSFKGDWKTVMSKFQSRVSADDKKAEDLVTKNDVSGLIALVNQRIANVDATTQEILKLYPPASMDKLQAITLFYLQSLKDQLTSQNGVNNAALAGQPTTDLKKISDQAASQARGMAGLLGIELQKLGITLGPQPAPQPSSSSASK